eukprot:3559238-Pyramimonas_sp.AAC.1
METAESERSRETRREQYRQWMVCAQRNYTCTQILLRLLSRYINMRNRTCVPALSQRRRETPGAPESLAPRQHKCVTANINGPCKGEKEEGEQQRKG